MHSFLTAVFLCSGLCAAANAQSWSFIRIADTTQPMPNSAVLFQQFNAPSIRDGVVAFNGFNFSAGRRGAYWGSAAGLSAIADTSTPAPGGGTFSGFFFELGFAPSAHGAHATFNAGSPSGGGVFLKSNESFAPVLTTAMQIPNGFGVTFNVIGQPSLESGRVAITGGVSTSGGAGGVYSWQSGVLSVVADHTTQMPGGPGTFERIFDCDLDQGTIIFSGDHKFGHGGVYRADAGGTLSRLYDTTMPVPGGGGNFTFLGQAVQSDGRVAFYGQGGGTEGVYTDVSGALEVVANRSTPIPGLPGQVFGGFSKISIDDGVIAFNAITNSGLSGIYSTHTGTLAKVLRFGDALDGRIVAGVSIGGQAMDGNSMAIWVRFTNGDYGVYMATIPAPGASGVFVAVAALTLRRRGRRQFP